MFNRLVPLFSLLLLGCGLALTACDSDDDSTLASSPPPSSNPPPTSPPPNTPRATLDLTPDIQVTEDIRLLAERFGNDPVRIFEHVRNNFEFEPYYFGSLKGSQETFLQRAGNDYDLASLIIALLHNAGIQGRYARASITVPIDQAISWIGVENGQVAEQILTAAGLNARLISNGGVATALELPHVWAEARLMIQGREEWVALDPSFKLHTIAAGRNIAREAGISGQALTQALLDRAGFSPNSPKITLPSAVDTTRNLIAQRLETVRTYLQNQQPTLTMRQIIGGKTIIPSTVTALPVQLPFTVQGPVERFDVIPNAVRHQVRVFFQGINTVFALPEIAAKRLTISFVAATPADQARIDSFGGILSTPPSAASLN